MRALILLGILCCARPSYAAGPVQSSPLGLLDIDLVIEPEHLPRFVCVLTADPPACREGERCFVALDQVREEVTTQRESDATKGSDGVGEVEVASEEALAKLRLQNGSALNEALRVLARHDGVQPCQDDRACPRSIAAKATGRYLSCAARPKAAGSLAAVLDLSGTLTSIVSMNFEESHVLVNTKQPPGSVWVTSAGGHFATGLSQPALRMDNSLRVTIPLSRRCQERTVQLPVGNKNMDHLEPIEIREGLQRLLTCDPVSFAENNIVVQMPIGREGIVRTLSARSSDGAWEATTTWTSRTPPETLKLWWRQMSFDVRPDCVLPAPVAVNQPDACPAVSLAGAHSCTKLTSGDTCTYQCTAVAGGAIVTPAIITFSYAGMEWTDTLAAAFGTLVARPPSDIRRLYFSTLKVEELEAIAVRGPRGFEQRIRRDDLQREGEFSWLSMPGLQCNDTVSYVYEGRFRHGEQQQRLTANPLLRLAPLDDTWHYPISLYVGGGAVVTELGRPAPYAGFGAGFGGPFGGDYIDRNSLLRHRFVSGIRLAWHLSAEIQLTYRRYDRKTAPVPSGDGLYSVVMQRQLIWLGFGYDGFRTSPTLLRTAAPSGAYLRIGFGQAIPIDKDDRAIIGNNDFVMAVQAIFHRRFSERISGEGELGLLLGERVRDYQRMRDGSVVVANDDGWHGLRFFYGFQLSITP